MFENYAWEITKNQRSGLSKKVKRFQKWPQSGNIPGYAHFHSSSENLLFYTKYSFSFWIFVFVEEKYKAFFVGSHAKTRWYFMWRWRRPRSSPIWPIYYSNTYRVYWGTVWEIVKMKDFKDGMGRAKSSLDRPWNPGTMKRRFDSIVTGPGLTVTLLFDNPGLGQVLIAHLM